MLKLLLDRAAVAKRSAKPKARKRKVPPMGERGQGRKTLDPNGERMKVHHIRTTDAQWERFHEKGGTAGFRAWLESD